MWYGLMRCRLARRETHHGKERAGERAMRELSMSVSDEVYDQLQELAARKRTDIAGVLGEAIALELEVAEAGEVVVPGRFGRRNVITLPLKMR
jgi:hypothetical protein